MNEKTAKPKALRPLRLVRLGGAVTISCALLTAPAAAAGPKASEIVDGVSSDDKSAVGYMQGVIDGYSTANYYLIQRHDGNLLYCTPNGLVLTLAQTEDILSRYIDKHPMEGSFPAKAVILVALEDVFPCPAAKP